MSVQRDLFADCHSSLGNIYDGIRHDLFGRHVYRIHGGLW